jgi:hypothetical protein
VDWATATAGQWGAATDDSGGIAMSSMVMGDRSLDTFERETPAERPVQAHPRGRGFRVLSHIARIHAEEYAPRHRLNAPAEADAQTSVAS